MSNNAHTDIPGVCSTIVFDYNWVTVYTVAIAGTWLHEFEGGEVDVCETLLVQELRSADTYGTCAECGELVTTTTEYETPFKTRLVGGILRPAAFGDDVLVPAVDVDGYISTSLYAPHPDIDGETEPEYHHAKTHIQLEDWFSRGYVVPAPSPF